MHTGDPSLTPLSDRIRSAPRHSGADFKAHLEGTAALLRAWGCRRELQLAGRYHSVYGNPQGRAAIASLGSRELIAVIGAEAEQLVWLWAQLDRTPLVAASSDARRCQPDDSIELSLVAGGTVRVSKRILLDLLHLHAANELEQAARTGRASRELDPLRPVLRAAAVTELDRNEAAARRGTRWRALAGRLKRGWSRRA